MITQFLKVTKADWSKPPLQREIIFQRNGSNTPFGRCKGIQLDPKDQKKATPARVSMAKRACVDMACDVAREARRLLGANGILVDYASMRHMANLESVYTPTRGPTICTR